MRQTPEGQLLADTAVELTDRVVDGTLNWDVPEGRWRVFLLILTRDWGGDPDYLNPIDADAVRVLIDAVYEPHRVRYAADFGHTFAGFFSDEPSFGNAKGFRHLKSSDITTWCCRGARMCPNCWRHVSARNGGHCCPGSGMTWGR